MKLNIDSLRHVNTIGIEEIYLCPFCLESKGHLSVNSSTGLWHCLRCGIAGKVDFGISTPKKRKSQKTKPEVSWPLDVCPIYLYDKIQLAKLCKADSSLTNFLLSRNLTFEDIARFQLGWKLQYLFIPILRNECLISGQFCRLDRSNPKLPKYIDLGPRNAFFNWNSLKNATTVLIVEGWLDTVNILHTFDYNFPVISSLGAKLTSQQLLQLRRFGRVIWGLDMDEAGQQASNFLPNSIQQFKVNWPAKDPGACSSEGIRYALNTLEAIN